MKKWFKFLPLLLVLLATSAMGSTITVVSGHDQTPIRGAQVVLAHGGKDRVYFTDKSGVVTLKEKLVYNTDIFLKKKKFIKRHVLLKRKRRVKVDLENYKVELFKKLKEDGVFLVTSTGYDSINYNPVEQEGDDPTELYITGTPTIIDPGEIKIIENNMDEAHMIHIADRGLFAFDPPDAEDKFAVGKYNPEKINEFVFLHVPKLEAGFYVVFPEIYSKYSTYDAFFFRVKK